MKLTARQAIVQEQVWLRPFGHFKPEDQGYMGFSSPEVRDLFFDRMSDGALVVIWTRRQEGEKSWIGKFRGILQMDKTKVAASACSSTTGNSLAADSSVDFSHAVRVARAWEADPNSKVNFSTVVPSIWPGGTQTIGHRSAQMAPSELSNLEGLKVREVSVWGQPPVSSGIFEEIRFAFK